ncbi:MAG: LytTR family DNA-binding domain-containing protein [Balneola sp.]
MNFRKTTLYFSIFILGIILFDALQQQYYLSTYDIVEDGSNIAFSTLFINHLIRWIVWGICSIPLVIVSWKYFSKSNQQIASARWILIFTVGSIGWLVSIFLISLTSLITNGEEFSVFDLLSTAEFFVYQKGITFIFAYCVLVLTLYSSSKNLVIDAQWIEIKDLKSNTGISNEISHDPQISIKIGNRLKLIPLNEVTWIEADDYCVKIHTERKAYSMRKSMKSLEEQLASYRFIRVHRGALLNLGYLDHVDFESSLIKLQDSSELPLSKSGAQVLRKALKENSI